MPQYLIFSYNRYYPRDPAMSSQTYHYKKGANQQFCQISHVFDPSKHPEEDLVYNADREIIPIAIYCVVDEGQEGSHKHTLSLCTYLCSCKFFDSEVLYVLFYGSLYRQYINLSLKCLLKLKVL